MELGLNFSRDEEWKSVDLFNDKLSGFRKHDSILEYSRRNLAQSLRYFGDHRWRLTDSGASEHGRFPVCSVGVIFEVQHLEFAEE